MISSEVVFDIADKEVELKELEKRSSEEGFWSDPEKAKEFFQKIIFNYPSSIYLVDARKQFRILRGDDIQ